MGNIKEENSSIITCDQRQRTTPKKKTKVLPKRKYFEPGGVGGKSGFGGKWKWFGGVYCSTCWKKKQKWDKITLILILVLVVLTIVLMITFPD